MQRINASANRDRALAELVKRFGLAHWIPKVLTTSATG